MLPLYNILSLLALIVYFPCLIFKKGPEDKKTFIKERLGISSYTKADLWVHAVSVGEIIACLPFLKKLKKEFPSKKIVLSTTTYTGQKIARDRFPEADRIMYMPFDTGVCIRKAVKNLKPELFITAETELWPALFFTLHREESRIVILNGRISQASHRGYKKIRTIMRKVLAQVDYLAMQSEEDAARVIEIGADSERVGVMGNFKFDIEVAEGAADSWQTILKGNIFLAASTHRGEDEIILDAYELMTRKAVRTNQGGQGGEENSPSPELKLLIAPRHPERFDEVASGIAKRNLEFIRRTTIEGNGNPKLPGIILLDSIGELSGLFSLATVAFIGGSLVPTGGHNILEPAYWSKPILFGPHMDNFPIAQEFLSSGAALEVTGAEEIAQAVTDLLTDIARSREMGQKAKSIVDKNTGAVKKAIEIIRRYIGTA